jgi:hypothetical protein
MGARASFWPAWSGAGSAVLVLIASILLQPLRAGSDDARSDPTAAMQTWLEEIDAGHYTQSWNEASPAFQRALSAVRWAQKLKAARVPLGKLTSRTFDTAAEQTEAPSPAGTVHGDFIIAQFDSSFANLKYAVETVTFEKTPNGEWRAAGYYIRPK